MPELVRDEKRPLDIRAGSFAKHSSALLVIEGLRTLEHHIAWLGEFETEIEVFKRGLDEFERTQWIASLPSYSVVQGPGFTSNWFEGLHVL